MAWKTVFNTLQSTHEFMATPGLPKESGLERPTLGWQSSADCEQRTELFVTYDKEPQICLYKLAHVLWLSGRQIEHFGFLTDSDIRVVGHLSVAVCGDRRWRHKADHLSAVYEFQTLLTCLY